MLLCFLILRSEGVRSNSDWSRLSENELDPDAPIHQGKKQRSRPNAPRSDKLLALKAQLRDLLEEPLMARGVSAKYPTSGSKVIVDDLLTSTGESFPDVGAVEYWLTGSRPSDYVGRRD